MLPQLKARQVIDTMAEARASGLPGALDDVARVLGLQHQKDKIGHGAMMKLCKPFKNRDGSLYYNEDPMLYGILYDYCKQDVAVERAIFKTLPRLSPDEQAMWVLDSTINNRGVHIDLPSVGHALEVVAAETKRLDEAVSVLTGGKVPSARKGAKLIEWLAENGLQIDNLKRVNVANTLKEDALDPQAIEALKLRQESSKASTAKLRAMHRGACDDGRARGLLTYHGAATGRWAGRRVQPQNMVRTPEEFDEACIADVLDTLPFPNAAKMLRLFHGTPMEVIAWIMRSFITAGPGNTLMAADFANIEGRVISWLAGEQWKLKAFRDFDAGIGPDLYVLAYARSFGLDVSEVTKLMRQLGKVQELALNYQGGVGAFKSMAANYGIHVVLDRADAPKDAKQVLTEAEADAIKVAWRAAHPAVVKFWYALERAAIAAIEQPGTIHPVGRIAYKRDGNFLKCRLPSGRVMKYYRPSIEREDGRNKITYEGLDTYTHKWGYVTSYGGKLAENVTQAVARDCLADAIKRCEAAGYPTVMHVHDENVAEVPIGGKQTLAEFFELMAVVPAWAEGLPIAVDGWEGKRYRK